MILTSSPRIKNAGRKFEVFCIVWLALSANECGAETSSSLDGAFATGRYRNLFAEAGHLQPEIWRKVDSTFQQLFHGNLTNITTRAATPTGRWPGAERRRDSANLCCWEAPG
jgi:hypothetical protein